ncbi:hypothetical protein F5Y19DRAFT_458599 [Xylariaceae sp. FL1651]|nr:hypothetical protein F5Y19DRAFT_458599 [Xylariaceae sp. FL1651]
MVAASGNENAEAADIHYLKSIWLETTDLKLRRKLQNRINQRLCRGRKASKGLQSSAPREASRLRSTQRLLLPKGSKGTSGVCTLDTHVPGCSSLDPTSHLCCSDVTSGKAVAGPGPSMQSGWRESVPASIDPLEAIQPALTEIHTKRIFHYTLQTLLPTLGAKTLSGEILPIALFREAIRDPLVFQATIVGGAGRRVTYTHSQEDYQTFLRAQSSTAKAIREALGANRVTDGLLFAIMALSLRPNVYAASLSPDKRYQGAFDSPVKEVGGLTWLGLIELAPEHANMLLYLLKARQKSPIKFSPGLAEYLQLADLLQASLTLSQPQMELTDSYKSVLVHEARDIRLPKSEASAFRVGEYFKDIILDMKLCCRLIQTFTGKMSFDSETSRFVQYRDLIQYRLLKLPRSHDTTCRLAVMIFSFGVLFPVPDPRPMQRLISELHDILLGPGATTCDDDEELLLWAAFVGGIGAAEVEVRRAFAGLVSRYATRLGIEEWDAVVSVLKRFLWLECACEVGGKALWQQSTSLTNSRILTNSKELTINVIYREKINEN